MTRSLRMSHFTEFAQKLEGIPRDSIQDEVSDLRRQMCGDLLSLRSLVMLIGTDVKQLKKERKAEGNDIIWAELQVQKEKAQRARCLLDVVLANDHLPSPFEIGRGPTLPSRPSLLER